MKVYSSLILTLVFIFNFVIIVDAQSSKNSSVGKISGKLRNCYGEGISDAKIIIKGEKFKRKLKSDKTGEFIVLLPTGKYNILIQKYGFMSYLYSDIKVQTDSEMKIEVDMKFGYATSDPNHDKPLSKPCPTQQN